MRISDHTAKMIVEKLKDVIDYDLNFFDQEGYIIYSTNSNRIGTYHEAAKECVKKNKTIFVDNEKEYVGAKKGINIPVTIDGEIIAVIGITGNKDEVMKYGNIIKKMTEILVKEQLVEKNKLKKKDMNKYLFESLINELDDYGLYRYLESEDEKYVIVGKNSESRFLLKDSDQIYKILENNLSNNFVYSVFYGEIVILANNVDKIIIKKKLEKIRNQIHDAIDSRVYFGISGSFKMINQFKKNYDNCMVALDWLDNLQRKDCVVDYSTLDLGILLGSIKKDRIKKFKEVVLKDISDEDYNIYKDLIKIYATNNQSITKCAEDLFVHKNTVQYRLNKLRDITGLDPRNVEDFIRLYLAFILN